MFDAQWKKAKNLLYLEDLEENKPGQAENFEGIETEIVTEIILPAESPWRWVVIAGSFICAFITDGIFFTFGSVYKDMSGDLGIDITLVTLINSIAIGLLFITGPVTSAFINRFGFRICAMTGSILVSSAYCTSSFSKHYAVVLVLYGIISGIGASFISISAQLIVCFYFERIRALAVALSGMGSSFGIAVMSIINTFVISLSGWRTLTLIYAGLFGMVYFVAMVFTPLLTLNITPETENLQPVTYLPSLSKISVQAASSSSQTKSTSQVATGTERLFSAVSNSNYPTTAEMCQKAENSAITINKGPGPSSASSTSKMKVTARISSAGISQNQLKQVRSLMLGKHSAEFSTQFKFTVNVIEPVKKRRWFRRCCRWDAHIKRSRPMYRDDVFYQGPVHDLKVYKDQLSSPKAGLGYQMAVSRAAAVSDLEERGGLCTTAVRRVLATMLDPKLLKRNSFFMVCTTNFLVHLGLIVPFIFLPDRNRSEGIPEVHCESFVGVIGLSNAVGRLDAGLLGCKYNPVMIYCIGCIITGSSVIASNLSFNIYYQYGCCIVFGFSAAHINTLRGAVLVDLYGIENLTNATGIVLMFAGFGSVISTPLSGVIKNNFGFMASFYAAGTFMTMAGLIVVDVKRVAKSEMRKKSNQISDGKYSSVILKKRKGKSVQNLTPIPEIKILN